MHLPFIFFNPHLRIYLLLIWETEGDRETDTERDRQIDRQTDRHWHWLLASHMCPDQGSNLQPSCVPWPVTDLANFRCTGQCSKQLNHLAKAAFTFSYDPCYFPPPFLLTPCPWQTIIVDSSDIQVFWIWKFLYMVSWKLLHKMPWAAFVDHRQHQSE